MRRSVFRATLLSLLGLLLAGTSPAVASPPDHGSFLSDTFFVDTEVCADAPFGFDVNVHEVEAGFFEIFRDAAGAFMRANVHFTYDATISANGTTIVEKDTWNRIFYADGTSRMQGSSVHITGPEGLVVRDAGQVTFDADGNIVSSHGPHQQLVDGVSFCPALQQSATSGSARGELDASTNRSS